MAAGEILEIKRASVTDMLGRLNPSSIKVFFGELLTTSQPIRGIKADLKTIERERASFEPGQIRKLARAR